MATLDDLFQQLHNRSEISTLIGQTEDLQGMAAEGRGRPENPGALALKARIELLWENWSTRRCRV
jgi:hypothetical protein